MSLDSILDSTLDELADAPEFKPFPAGAHRCTVEFKEKEINKKPAIEITLTAIESVELADQTAEPVKQGSTTNELLILRNNDGSKNEISEGALKKHLSSLQQSVGGANLREVMANAKGVECLVVTKLRTDKRDDSKRTSIVSMNVI